MVFDLSHSRSTVYVPFRGPSSEAQIARWDVLKLNELCWRMKAVILAGGYATRLRPVSYAMPKLLFPVLGKPMIYWQLDLLRDFGVDEVVLAVNYLADLLRKSVGERYRGMVLRYSNETTPLGTAGPIKLASQALRFDDTFIAMNGDIISDVDLVKMLKHHRETGATVTDALHSVPDPSRFGVVQMDPSWRIRQFVEKPRPGKARTHLVNAGIYLMEPHVLRMIPAGRKVSLERDVFPILAERGRLSGFVLSGNWFDIGNMADFKRANLTLLDQRAKRENLLSKRDRVSSKASLNPPNFIGEDNTIEKEATVGPQVLTAKNVCIMRRARIVNSILFDGVKVGKDSVISGTILASNVTVGEKVRIEDGSIISPHVKISSGVKIGRNAIIHPFKEIESDIKARTNLM
jgi:mannose-1-phosphate guanylyltransferase